MNAEECCFVFHTHTKCSRVRRVAWLAKELPFSTIIYKECCVDTPTRYAQIDPTPRPPELRGPGIATMRASPWAPAPPRAPARPESSLATTRSLAARWRRDQDWTPPRPPPLPAHPACAQPPAGSRWRSAVDAGAFVDSAWALMAETRRAVNETRYSAPPRAGVDLQHGMDSARAFVSIYFPVLGTPYK